MSNSVEPVDIDFVLKHTNFAAEGAKMKAEIAGVTDTVEKEAVKMTKAMNDFATQTATQLKASIQIQKQAIKDLQQQIKELNNTVSSSTGKDKIAASSALATARRDLVAEQGALLAMQKQLTSGNVAEEKSQTSLIGGLGRWAVGLFSVVAAMKVTKEIIESTEKTSSFFEKTMNAATTATNYFFRAIASGDWSNFWEGMDRAVLGAVKYTEEMEKVERRTIEQEVKSAEAQKQISDLRSGTFDKGVENTDKLIQNLSKIIEIQKVDFTRQAVIAKDKYELTKNQMALDNKMSADKIEALTFEYTKNEQLMALAERYNEVSKKLGAGIKSDYLQRSRPEKYTELKNELLLINSELETAYGMTGKEAVDLVAKFEKPTLKALKSLAELKKSQVQLEGQSQIGSRRDENQLAAAINRKQTAVDEAAQKAQDKANQLSKKQIDYESEIGRQRISNQIEIEQTLLNSQKDSAEKQRKQAELDFRKTLVDIANQKESQLKKVNEANGGIDLKTGKKTDKYVSVLPEADQKQVDEKVIAAEELKNSKVDAINEKAGEKIKEIWQEVSDFRLKGIEKEKAAINKYYDEQEKSATEAKDAALLAAIPTLRNSANTEIDNKYALQKIDFEEKIEKQKNQIQATGFDREAKLMKLNFDTWVKYNNQRIALLKKSNDPKDKQNAQLLQGEIEIETLTRKSKLQDDILNSARQFTGEMIEQLGLSQDESKQLQGMADIVMNLASGNFVGAAFGAASTLITALSSGTKKEDPTTKALENVNELLKQQSTILANLAGSNYFELAAKQFDEYGKAIDLNNQKLQTSHILTKEEYAAAQKYFNQQKKDFPNGPLAQIGWQKYRSQLSGETANWTPDDFVKAYADGSLVLDKQQIEWVQGIVESQKQRAELLQETFRNALGFDASEVSDSIYQGIEDGLRLGENSLGGFAQSFGELMKKALMQAIIDSTNTDITTNFLPKIKEFLQNDEVGPNGEKISPREQAILEGIYSTIVKSGEENSAAVKLVTDQYGVGASSSTAMTGIYRNLTEDTGSALIGQLTAVRIDIKDVLKQIAMGQDDASRTLLYMRQIAENTSYNKELVVIRDEMKDMNKTLKDRL